MDYAEAALWWLDSSLGPVARAIDVIIIRTFMVATTPAVPNPESQYQAIGASASTPTIAAILGEIVSDVMTLS